MKKALITGVSGFVGSHLAGYLVSQNIKVTGLRHPKHKDAVKLPADIEQISCDILDKKRLEKVIGNDSFDYIFHLAAFSSPPQSFVNPKETLENNIHGQLNLLESLSKNKADSKILIVSSGEIYGDIDEDLLPVNENAPFRPQSPYAVSKIAQDMLGLQFYLTEKLKVVRVRPFNHIGPGQSKQFVVPAFASQIAMCEKKGSGEIRVGNLESWRDFTDVRDMTRAYLLALDKGVSGEVYNIGSGKSYKIADILDELISMSDAEIKVRQEKSLLRQDDTKKIYCDYSKFKTTTGWAPEIPISKTLFDTIEYERAILKI